MITWIVMYQTNTGAVFGWLCKANRPSEAEDLFWHSMSVNEGRTIKCITEVQSNVVDAYFELYGGETHGER